MQMRMDAYGMVYGMDADADFADDVPSHREFDSVWYYYYYLNKVHH